jgi:hypothetical protein
MLERIIDTSRFQGQYIVSLKLFNLFGICIQFAFLHTGKSHC